METIFDKNAAINILDRIELLTPLQNAIWGKMNISQMFAHCAIAFEFATGKINVPMTFIGKMIGRFYKPIYSNKKPFPKNIKTLKEALVTDKKDFYFEKKRLILAINEMQKGGEIICTTLPHPFFGKLTPAQWGIGMYKHLDHHLRQFGV